jgi:aminopeptidase N
MKNPEIWADAYIEACLNEGFTTRREIIKEFKRDPATEGSEMGRTVEELLRNRESKAWEDFIDAKECRECDSDLMYDTKNDFYYCPLCE